MSFAVPDVLRREAVCLGALNAPSGRAALTDREIRDRLEAPVWPPGSGPAVFEVVRPGEKVCFVISDHTRRTAADRVLPVLLSGLAERGCDARDMHLLVATGIHRPPAPEELGRILGPAVYGEFRARLHAHDPDAADLVEVGALADGHRVRVNRRALEADRLVPLGAAGFHYHAGFGGGRKSLVPGLAARATIAHNHSLALDPREDRLRAGVETGRLDGNPVAEEMLRAARMCDPDIIVNTVLSPSGELAGVFSGELDAAHRAACAAVREMLGFGLEEPADIVLADAGSAGDWIQSHKALVNASRALRPGGRVILRAPCPEGLGNERFRHYLRMESTARMCAALRAQPEVNGQTALSTRERGRCAVLVTDLGPEDRRDLGIATAPDLESAAARAISDLRAGGVRRPTYLIMPQALYTVPFPRGAA